MLKTSKSRHISHVSSTLPFYAIRAKSMHHLKLTVKSLAGADSHPKELLNAKLSSDDRSACMKRENISGAEG